MHVHTGKRHSQISLKVRTYLNHFSTAAPPPAPETNTAKVAFVKRGTQIAIAVLLALFCMCFLAGALRAAVRNHLWMDEILAVWVARLPTAHLVWSAVFHGSEASPPTYDLILHGLIKAGASSYLLLRLPSILATLFSGFCVFTLLRRYLQLESAACGAAFSLLGILAWQGIEARPYSLVTACFAAAVLLWDRLESPHPRIWRIAAISALLAFAVCLHFYAALLVPCVGTMELLWSLIHRRVRVSMWLGLILAGACSFVWLPLIRFDSHFIAGEIKSAEFYGRPTLSRLIHAYSDLMAFDKKQILFIAAAISLIAAAAALRELRAKRLSSTDPSTPPGHRSNLYVIAFCTVAFPLLAFIFALFVTKTFNTRYALIGSFGFSLLLACTISAARAARPAVCAILLAACPLALLSGTPPPAVDIPNELGLLTKATGPYPIVVPDGRLYFELVEAASPDLKSRFVYVDLPPGTPSPDPTDEHHVDRWHRIRPDLRIMSAQNFFAHNPHFYIFHSSQSLFVLTNWLIDRGLVTKPVAQYQENWLLEAQAPQQ